MFWLVQFNKNFCLLLQAGYRSLSDLNLGNIRVDPCGDGEAASEGAYLAAFKYQDLKSKKKESPEIACFVEDDIGFVVIFYVLHCIVFFYN